VGTGGFALAKKWVDSEFGLDQSSLCVLLEQTMAKKQEESEFGRILGDL
jgi:hypothetical protein